MLLLLQGQIIGPGYRMPYYPPVDYIEEDDDLILALWYYMRNMA